MARRRGLTVATGSAATVVLTTVSGALINELHGGWGWWVATAAVVLAMAVLTWWLAAQQDGSAQAASRPTVIVSSHVDQAAAGPGTRLLRYEDRADGGRIHIEPRDPYLDLVRGGGELTPVKYWHSPWERRFRWPTLDVKVVNNTGRSVLFHRAVFRVARSRPDLRAIPIIHDIAYGTYLPLVDAGWGEMTDCVLRFRIHADGAPVTDELEWRFGTVEGAYREEGLRGFFADAGVDFAALDRLAWTMYNFLSADAPELAERRRALGPFADGLATLRGTLTYTHVGADGLPERAAHPIVSHVSFDEHPVGAPAPPTYNYQVRLRPEGSDYEVDVPVSQAIPAGGTDRFAFTIAASRSSFHDLTLLLRYNDEEPVVSDPVSLELFASRFDVRYQEFD